MDKNKEFAELVGVCWHENEIKPCSVGSMRLPCSKCGSNDYNPDYAADPRLVLVEMMKRDDWKEFIQWLFREYVSFEQIPYWLEYFILDTTGRCRDAAIEFMREEKT